MKRTPLNKIGKIGKRNLEANKILKWIYTDRCITTCEVKLPGCAHDNMLSFAHKNKREWYRNNPKALYSFEETVLACIPCHDKMEADRQLTREVFHMLRGV